MADNNTKLMSIVGPRTASPPKPPAELTRQLKFTRDMTNKELEHHYNLHYLSDELLARVGLERSSMIDDYRRIHEISHLFQQRKKREKTRRRLIFEPEERAEPVKEQPPLRTRPHKAYKFKLLKQLVRVMDTEPDPKAIFPETQFDFLAIYSESEEVRRLAPRERERLRFDAFYEHLENMFVNGDRNKAIDVVLDAFVRVKKRRMQDGHVPIPRVQLKFARCCLMTAKQLEHHHNLHQLSDELLASVGLDRSSVIDAYRLIHKISHLHQQGKMPEKTRRMLNFEPEDRVERVKELQLRLGMHPHNAYKFQLLNKLVRAMDTEPDPKVIFPETQFDFLAIYSESEEVRRLAPRERERLRFDAFYEHLDNMFVNGDSDKAIDLVEAAFVRLKKRRMQDSQVPIPSGYFSPRSAILIPRTQKELENELLWKAAMG